MRLSITIFIIVFYLGHASQDVRAAVTVDQALSFGTFLVMKNDAQYDITVNADGSSTYDAGAFVEIVAPQRGIYLFDGLDSSRAIVSVDVTQGSPMIGGGSFFQLVNFQEIHPPTTNGVGEAQIFIGATARSSGNGTPYSDQTYLGTVDITINY